MPEEPVDPTAQDSPAPAERVPWYSLNPRHLRFSKFTWSLLAFTGVVLLLVGNSVKPLWVWGWRHHIYCASQRSAVLQTDPEATLRRGLTLPRLSGIILSYPTF